MRNFLAPRISINLYTVIRFSLRYESYMRVAFGEEAQRAAWFAMRARLFKSSIVESIQRQTVAPRRVFVLMDVGDQDLWHEHLDLPAPFVPLFVPATNAFDEVARRISADRTKNVVLARLDSDDAISVRYFEKIVGHARNLWRQGISKGYMVVPNGYFTDLQKIQKIYYNCSPFISLYLGRYNGENIFDGDHTRILERHPRMVEDASWMQIIHGSNVDNRIYKESKFAPDDERRMELGALKAVTSGWPTGFPPQLLGEARAVRESWRTRSVPAVAVVDPSA